MATTRANRAATGFPDARDREKIADALKCSPEGLTLTQLEALLGWAIPRWKLINTIISMRQQGLIESVQIRSPSGRREGWLNRWVE
jgi:hypothetical protein